MEMKIYAVVDGYNYEGEVVREKLYTYESDAIEEIKSDPRFDKYLVHGDLCWVDGEHTSHAIFVKEFVLQR